MRDRRDRPAPAGQRDRRRRRRKAREPRRSVRGPDGEGARPRVGSVQRAGELLPAPRHRQARGSEPHPPQAGRPDAGRAAHRAAARHDRLSDSHWLRLGAPRPGGDDRADPPRALRRSAATRTSSPARRSRSPGASPRSQTSTTRSRAAACTETRCPPARPWTSCAPRPARSSIPSCSRPSCTRLVRARGTEAKGPAFPAFGGFAARNPPRERPPWRTRNGRTSERDSPGVLPPRRYAMNGIRILIALAAVALAAVVAAAPASPQSLGIGSPLLGDDGLGVESAGPRRWRLRRLGSGGSGGGRRRWRQRRDRQRHER